MGKQSNRKWYIGMDFGTSNTRIVAYNKETGKCFTSASFQALDKNGNIPTVITEDIQFDDRGNFKNNVYVGIGALAHSSFRPFSRLKDVARLQQPGNGVRAENVIRDYSDFSNCKIENELNFGNDYHPNVHPVKDVIVDFFKEILRINEEEFKEIDINKDSVARIVVGCPCDRQSGDDKLTYEKTLKDIVCKSFCGENNNCFKRNFIEVAAEPELAGIAHLYVEEDRDEKRVLVIDVGGGTTDFSVLHWENGKTIAENIGFCNTAGNSIDEAIYDKLDGKISKLECRRAKEVLFAKTEKGSEGDMYIPRECEELEDKENYFVAHNDKNEKAADLRYNNNGLDKIIAIKECIDPTINALKEELKKALGNYFSSNDKPKFNTILFAGGTTFITPLREELEEAAKSNCEEDYKVVTMFGNDRKRLTIDEETPLEITPYTAVAIGALIKAMGENNLCIRPKIKIEDIYYKEMQVISLGKELIIKTETKIPIAYTYFTKEEVERNKRAYNSNDCCNRTIKLSINTSEKKYKNPFNPSLRLEQGEEGLLIYVCISTNGIECKACLSSDPNGSNDNNVICEIIKLGKDKEINMELKDQQN